MKTKLKECFRCNAPRIIWKQFEGHRYCQICWSKIKPPTASKRTALVKTQKPIPKRSDRRKKLDTAYSILRKIHLETHKFCELQCSSDCTKIGTDIHHLFWAGDREEHMNDFAEILVGCRNCHNFVHTKMSAEEARKKGFKK